MRAHALSRWRLPPLKDVVAVTAAAAYVVVWLELQTGHRIPIGIGLFFAPLALLPLALLRRLPLTRAQGASLAVMTVLPLATAWALLIGVSWLSAAAVPVMVVVAIVCSRFPGAAVAVLLTSATAYGSFKVYLHWSGQKTLDAVIVGLWLAAIWRWVVFPRAGTQRAIIWPGVACVAGYFLFTAGEILTAPTTSVGMQSFRQSVWLMGVALLVAYAPWKDGTRDRLEKIALASIVLVGGYATLRWNIGPSGKEEALARSVKNNFLDGELRPIGSFFSVKELAAWSGITAPFAVGMALVLRGRWRLVAIAACAAAAMAMFAADVRAAPAAAVPGVLAVLVLYSLSQAFRGHRGATVALAIIATTALGAGAFALTLGDHQDSGRRYKAILDPGNDPSYQGRLIKWRAAWEDVRHHPFGNGLGTTGIVQERFGENRTIGSIDVDNSYVKIAFEQGFIVMVLYCATVLLLLAGLARRALVTMDRTRAGPAIAACGTLVSMLVLFFIGDYVEGIYVTTGWLFVGLGLRQFTWEPRDPRPPDPEPLAGKAW
jgi:O-Antigen ligase